MNSFFQYGLTKELYELQGVIPIEPMTAKEITDEDKQDEVLNGNPLYTVDEKFDGVRQTLHFYAPNSLNKVSAHQFTPTEMHILVPFLKGVATTQLMSQLYEVFQSNLKVTPQDIHTYLSREDYKVSRNNLTGVFNDNRNKLYVGEVETKMSQFTYERVSYVMTELFKSFELFPRDSCVRAFSRRMSTKSNWYSENTDSMPHLRDIDIPELAGTILDGEMKLDNRPFGEVSGLLNCTWDEAQKRQSEMNQWTTYHVFDIVRYKGIDITSLPLKARRVFLRNVIAILRKYGYTDIVPIPYYPCEGNCIPVIMTVENCNKVIEHKELYPNLYARLDIPILEKVKRFNNVSLNLNPRQYYEYIVSSGGEGVMIKSIDGRYYGKRGREYQKIKSFLSRELVILGFEAPTKEYTGKFPNDSWDYWETKNNGKIITNGSQYSALSLVSKGYVPVTRYYAQSLVGNLILGVCVDPKTKEKLLKNKKFSSGDFVNCYKQDFLIVCICGGFNDTQREDFTKYYEDYICKVVEVKANGIFTDTGKLRHPRFLRVRDDKDYKDCTFEDHISQ